MGNGSFFSFFFSSIIGYLGKLFLANRSFKCLDCSNFEGCWSLLAEECTESTEFFFIEILRGRRGLRFSTLGLTRGLDLNSGRSFLPFLVSDIDLCCYSEWSDLWEDLVSRVCWFNFRDIYETIPFVAIWLFLCNCSRLLTSILVSLFDLNCFFYWGMLILRLVLMSLARLTWNCCY
jgi:hypothetical protein